ncbi:MAG: epimerase [Acidimicrobiales bacterium]
MDRSDPLDVVLVGGSGFLGRGLRARLVNAGHRVTVIGRGPGARHDGWRSVGWDGVSLGSWAEALEGADVIVHLAGKRVDCRPTRSNIDELIRSREWTVELVGRAVGLLSQGPSAWVQLSSLARFGDGGERLIDESTPPPDDGPRQQVEVCRRWEAAYEAASAGIERRVLLRPGIGIGGAGDPATVQLARVARLGLAGPVGSGRQWVSWIGSDDFFEILVRSVIDREMSGLYHVTAPEPVRNAEMMAAYREAVGRRFGLPTPRFMATIGALLLGSDPGLALTGRRCVPTRLLDEGFRFANLDFEQVVADAVGAVRPSPRSG